jgi:hypothetical protein
LLPQAPSLVIIVTEEARYGYILGVSRILCEASGGKHTSAYGLYGRCITRACYWFNECGYWAAPTRWLDRVAIGDPVSKVVFWFGEPHIVNGVYYWGRHKGSDRTFSAQFRNGRLIALDTGD